MLSVPHRGALGEITQRKLAESGQRAGPEVVDQRVLLGGAQAVLQRPEQGEGGDGEGRHRGDQNGADDPAAQAEGRRVPAAASTHAFRGLAVGSRRRAR